MAEEKNSFRKMRNNPKNQPISKKKENGKLLVCDTIESYREAVLFSVTMFTISKSRVEGHSMTHSRTLIR